jgi:hypothetical protein
MMQELRIRPAGFAALLAWLIVVQFLHAEQPPFFLLTPDTAPNPPVGARWTKEGANGGFCLRWDVKPADARAFHLLNIPLELKSLRDHEILLSWEVRAEGMSEPATSYGGIKVQLHYTSEANGPQWFSEAIPPGTFDWRASSLLIRVDGDATAGELQIGPQDASGTLWLANVSIKVIRARPTLGTLMFRGHDLPRLRGMVGSGAYAPQDLADMRALGANVVRWRLLNTKWARTDIPSDPALYEPWLEAKLDELELVLQDASARGMRVLVDLHSPPGGRLPDGTLRMVMEPATGDYYIGIWKRIARRFKGRPGLWAYDLMNEPVQKRPSPPGVRDWFALQEAAARAAREEDPDVPLLIEVDEWDSPQAFAWMRPVDVARVIYSVHMYWPHEYTHQGVEPPWKASEALSYPGKFNGRPFDRAALERQLAPVRKFQQATNSQIFVGEFSVTRWAPSAERYLADCIALFEEYGWDWTYHAFRESDAWSLEHADLPHPEQGPAKPASSGARRDAVLPWLGKNQFAEP